MTETLDTQEFINILKAKNIKFNIINEFKALNYLKYCNSYYNIISYEKNFEKYYIGNKFIDKYVNLEFAYLVDLAEIDLELRNILFKIVMAIEHHLKLRILNLIENNKITNTTIIIQEFLESEFKNDRADYDILIEKLQNKNIRPQSIHLWVFLEILTFGGLIRFYNLFIKKYKLKKEYENIYILRNVKKLRNEICHNNNLLSKINIRDNTKMIDYNVVKYLNKCNISKYNYTDKLKNSTIRTITYSLFMFNYIVKDKIKEEINNLFYVRITKSKSYYNCKLLKSIYRYFDKIIQKYCK